LRRLQKDGWEVERITGSHHVLKHPINRNSITLPHPKKDLGIGLVRHIYKQAGWKFD
jgi:predicted RNA binding protein YcfA (HicA-like mRNA interferase family)